MAQPGQSLIPTDYGIREHIGIAVDGGGVRGAMVARGLIELENILGTRPLINDPRVQVIAGTSTGSLIAGALALGLTGEQILALYERLGEEAFSKAGAIRPFGKNVPLLNRARLPIQVVRALEKLPLDIGEFILYLLMTARYSFDPLRKILQENIAQQTGRPGTLSLGGLGEVLRERPNRPTLIVTAVEVMARQTRFLKTTAGETYADFPVCEALLASSCIPTYFDPVPLPGPKPTRYLVDGGVGNFGNPALVVAWELCDERNPERHYDPSTVTLYSFGTGYVPPEVYQKHYSSPAHWWALEWAGRAPDLFVDDTIRETTRNLVVAYRGIDLRRFQVTFDRVVDPDRFDLINTYLKDRGEELRQLIREDRHALKVEAATATATPRYDPEHITNPATAALLQEQA